MSTRRQVGRLEKVVSGATSLLADVARQERVLSRLNSEFETAALATDVSRAPCG
jgi:hypothetical protein